MQKRSFARIDFENCDMDYSHTICEWQDVDAQIQPIIDECSELGDFAEDTFEAWNEMSGLPKAIVTPVLMTEDEFTAWFVKHVESRA